MKAPRNSPIKEILSTFFVYPWMDEVSKVKYGKPASNLFVAWLWVSGDPKLFPGNDGLTIRFR